MRVKLWQQQYLGALLFRSWNENKLNLGSSLELTWKFQFCGEGKHLGINWTPGKYHHLEFYICTELPPL